ncbi:TraB/GumN family protein [Candidatus Uabimicrobium sp. HlEnr_7]|uniref:TraB/GumN family protein n=1 Tax=Candidatus Uabimicrobium helgolandensis TaxID=3095367 RepID=UPI0035590586
MKYVTLLALTIIVFLFYKLLTDQSSKTRPILWKITGKSPCYLLASLHYGIKKNHIHNVVWEKMRTCQTIVFENNNNEDFATKTDTSLQEHLGKEYWNKVKLCFAPNVLAKVEYLEIWLLGVLLVYRTYPEGEGVEAIITKNSKQRIVGLEDKQDLLVRLRNFFTLEVVKNILDTNFEQDDSNIVALYKSGDLSGLNDYFDTLDEYYKQLLISERNYNWMPVLENIIKQGNAFIVVGAFHLLGEEGLICLLREKGYTVTRYKVS